MTRRALIQNRGSILVVTIWMVALLSLLALSVVSFVRLGVRAEAWARDEQAAEQLLAALARLAVRQSQTDESEAVDALNESWARPLDRSAEDLRSEFEGTSPAGGFRVSLRAIDECGKINVNLASEALLVEAIREAGGEGTANGLARAIVDWRDEDSDGPGEGDQTNAERTYPPSNRDLARVEELQFVRGVAPAMFAGEDANDNGALDPEEDDLDVFLPADNADGQLQLGLRELLTTYGDGTLNVNGASEAVLRAALRLAVPPGDAQSLAAKAIARRRGADGIDGTPDDKPFQSDEELRQAFGGAYAAIAGAGVALGVQSLALRYRLRVEMPDKHLVRCAELVVVREDGRVVIAEWRAQ